jgi:malate/lactate dehydrogenase
MNDVKGNPLQIGDLVKIFRYTKGHVIGSEIRPDGEVLIVEDNHGSQMAVYSEEVRKLGPGLDVLNIWEDQNEEKIQMEKKIESNPYEIIRAMLKKNLAMYKIAHSLVDQMCRDQEMEMEAIREINEQLTLIYQPLVHGYYWASQKTGKAVNSTEL